MDRVMYPAIFFVLTNLLTCNGDLLEHLQKLVKTSSTHRRPLLNNGIYNILQKRRDVKPFQLTFLPSRRLNNMLRGQMDLTAPDRTPEDSVRRTEQIPDEDEFYSNARRSRETGNLVDIPLPSRKRNSIYDWSIYPVRRAYYDINLNDGTAGILGSPTQDSHLPPAEPILPGHTLLRPALGMLKSQVKFPHRELENGAGVYGNVNNLGLSYANRNERVAYTGFRRDMPRTRRSLLNYIVNQNNIKQESTADKVLKAIKKIPKKPRTTDIIIVVADSKKAPSINKPASTQEKYFDSFYGADESNEDLANALNIKDESKAHKVLQAIKKIPKKPRTSDIVIVVADKTQGLPSTHKKIKPSNLLPYEYLYLNKPNQKQNAAFPAWSENVNLDELSESNEYENSADVSEMTNSEKEEYYYKPPVLKDLTNKQKDVRRFRINLDLDSMRAGPRQIKGRKEREKGDRNKNKLNQEVESDERYNPMTEVPIIGIPTPRVKKSSQDKQSWLQASKHAFNTIQISPDAISLSALVPSDNEDDDDDEDKKKWWFFNQVDFTPLHSE